MDYTQNLFKNEGNVKNPRTREQLTNALGLPRPKQNHSLLVNLVKLIKSGNINKVKLPQKEEVDVE